METVGCYKCSSREAKPVSFTWWGGLLGPKLLSHVRCVECGTHYNARSGQSNRKAIAIYVGVVLLALIALTLALQTR